jgi:hypothetical protein
MLCRHCEAVFVALCKDGARLYGELFDACLLRGGEPSLDGAGGRVLFTDGESVQLLATALGGLWVAEGVLWATYAIPPLRFRRDYSLRRCVKMFASEKRGESLVAQEMHTFQVPENELLQVNGFV